MFEVAKNEETLEVVDYFLGNGQSHRNERVKGNRLLLAIWTGHSRLVLPGHQISDDRLISFDVS